MMIKLSFTFTSTSFLSVATIFLLSVLVLVTTFLSHQASAVDIPPTITSSTYTTVDDSVPVSGTILNVAAMLASAAGTPPVFFHATRLSFKDPLSIQCPISVGGWSTIPLTVTIIDGLTLMGSPTAYFIYITGVLAAGSKVRIEGGSYIFTNFMGLADVTILAASAIEIVSGVYTAIPAASGPTTTTLINIDYAAIHFLLSGGSKIFVSDVSIIHDSFATPTEQVTSRVLYSLFSEITVTGGSSLSIEDVDVVYNNMTVMGLNGYLASMGVSMVVSGSSVFKVTQLNVTINNVNTQAIGGWSTLSAATTTITGSSAVNLHDVNVTVNNLQSTVGLHSFYTMEFGTGNALTISNGGAVFVSQVNLAMMSSSFTGDLSIGTIYSSTQDIILSDSSTLRISKNINTLYDITSNALDWYGICTLSKPITMSTGSTLLIDNNRMEITKGTIMSSPLEHSLLYASSTDISLLGPSCELNMTNNELITTNVTAPSVLRMFMGLRNGDVDVLDSSSIIIANNSGSMLHVTTTTGTLISEILLASTSEVTIANTSRFIVSGYNETAMYLSADTNMIWYFLSMGKPVILSEGSVFMVSDIHMEISHITALNDVRSHIIIFSTSDLTMSGASTLAIQSTSITATNSVVAGRYWDWCTMYASGKPFAISGNSTISITDTHSKALSAVTVTSSSIWATMYLRNAALTLLVGSSMILSYNSIYIDPTTTIPPSPPPVQASILRIVTQPSNILGTLTITNNILTASSVVSSSSYAYLVYGDSNITTSPSSTSTTSSSSLFSVSQNEVHGAIGTTSIFNLTTDALIVPEMISTCRNYVNNVPCTLPRGVGLSDGLYYCSANANLKGHVNDCLTHTLSISHSQSFTKYNTTIIKKVKAVVYTPVVPIGTSEPGFVSITAVTGGAGVIGGVVEGVSNMQVAAMFSYMACGTVSTSSSLMERVLLPLQVADSKAANVIGSGILLIGITTIYVGISHAVFYIIRHGTTSSSEGAAEARILKFKGLMLYPRLPVIILVLLLPGLSIESGSLVYGRLQGGEWWEVLLGVVGLLVSIGAAAYYIWVGVVVGRRVRTTLPRPSSPNSNTGTTTNGSSYVTTRTRPTTPNDVEHEGDAFNKNLDSDTVVCSNDDIAKPMVFDDPPSPYSHIKYYADSDAEVDRISLTSGLDKSESNTSNHNQDITAPTLATTVVRRSSSRGSRIMSNCASGEFLPCPTVVLEIEPCCTPTPSPDRGNDDDAGEEDEPLCIEKCKNNGSVPIVGGEENEFFVTYTSSQRQRIPWIVSTVLLPAAYWTKEVSRTLLFPVTSHRPDMIIISCGHSVIFIVSIGIVAAVDGGTVANCRIVQGIMAGLCFLNAVFICVTRTYRIPTLNYLQAVQSILLGLLACSDMIGEPVAQSAFVTTMLVASTLTTVVSFVAVAIEFRLQSSVLNATSSITSTASEDDEELH